MTLVEFVPLTPHPLWKLCPQMGITDVVVKVNPELTGLADPWRLSTLRSIVERLKVEGLNVVGLEGDPFDMSPIKEYGALDCISHVEHVDHVEWYDAQQPETTLHVSARSTRLNNPVNHVNPVKNKDDIREEALSHYRELLESMGRLGIKLLCYNFMVGKGWSRTGVREGRGGAKATYFSLKELTPKESDGSANASPIQNVGALAKTSDKSELKISHDQVWANYEYFIKAVMPTAEKCGVRMALHPDDPCLDSLGGYARIFGPIEAYDRVLTPEGTPGYFTLGRLFANGYLKALLRGSE